MKRFAIRLAAFSVVLSLCMLPVISGAQESAKSPATKKISGYIWGILLKLKPRSNDTYYRVTAVVGVRGFSTALPYEKSAFRFGALAAELQFAEDTKDEQHAKKTAALITEGLKQADIVLPSGDAPLPAEKLNTAIENFVKDKKLDDFYQFGQWVGSLHMALLSVRDGHMDAASELLGINSRAGYFLDMMKKKDMPPGIINNLRKLERMKNKSAFTDRDVKDAIGCLENIILLLG